ncbi:hypothetical protein [Entomomonas sp. E2T0]|nr:hypothetical protein [Entomomonas sp. E2T0]
MNKDIKHDDKSKKTATETSIKKDDKTKDQGHKQPGNNSTHKGKK